MIYSSSGCSSGTEPLTVRVADPDGGFSFEMPVDGKGAFFQETKNGDVVAVASGNISDETSDVYSVTLMYERKRGAASGNYGSARIKTTFTTKPDIEVAIGNSSSNRRSQPGDDFKNVTVMILGGR